MDEVGAPHLDPAPRAPVDLTPQALRERHRTLARTVRGYDPETVDHLLRRVADRLEALEDHNASLTERVNELAKKVFFHEGRAWAVQEALVTAQSLRAETQGQAEQAATKIRDQAAREADALLSAARHESASLRERASEIERKATALRNTVAEEIEQRRAASADEAETRLREVEQHARSSIEDAERHAAASRVDAEDYERRTRDAAEVTASYVKDEAAAEASAILQRAEAWAAEERARVSTEVENIREQSLQESRSTRDEGVKVSRSLRDRAKRDAGRMRENAQAKLVAAEAVIAQATSDVQPIREDLRREVEDIRARAQVETDTLMDQAAADATQIRDQADRESVEIRESAMLDLERKSAKLQVQIEERHRVLERLTQRRSAFLGSMRSLLLQELESVESARTEDTSTPAGTPEAGEDLEAVIIGSGLDEVGTPAAAAGTGPSGNQPSVALGWASRINPETGEVVSYPAPEGPPEIVRPLRDAPGPLDPSVLLVPEPEPTIDVTSPDEAKPESRDSDTLQ